VDERTSLVEFDVGREQLLDFAATKAGAASDKVGQAAFAVSWDDLNELVDRERAAAKRLVAYGRFLHDALERVMRHATFPHRPVYERDGVRQVFVARLDGQIRLALQPSVESLRGDVAQLFPAAFPDESPKTAARVDNV